MAHRARRSAAPALIAAALGLLIAAPLASAATLQSAPPGKQFHSYQQALESGATTAARTADGHGLGLRPEPMDPSSVGPSIMTGRLGLLGIPPAAYDLRTEGRLSPVKDQGMFGACWAFAAYGSVESVLMPTALYDFSEDHMVLTAGFDNGGDPYDAGGNYYMSTAYLTRWGGPVNEVDDTYGDGITTPGLTAAKHVQEALYIDGASSPTGNSALKSALLTYGAVGTAVSWDDAAYNATENSFFYGGSAATNHAVAIVGWDDGFAASRFATTPAGNGAWLVRNSWGAGWGDGGYFWVSYYDTYCGRDTVFNAVYTKTESASNFTSIYYHDPYGQVDKIGYEDSEGKPLDTAWGANVYTATRSQTINGIGFFTHVPGTTYSVYTGSVTAAGEPGTLTFQGSGTMNTAGYHTVKFTGSRWVTAGSKFAVAIRITVPTDGYPIAYEAPVVGFNSAATAAPLQSFMRYSNQYAWDDFTDYIADANLCIKAYGKNDTVKPSTTTYAKSVKRYTTATLRYRVKDPLPSCGAATCSIQIIKSGKVVKTISLGSKATNVTHSYRYKATLGRGTYSWRVTAKDRAGNTATTRTATKLVIY